MHFKFSHNEVKNCFELLIDDKHVAIISYNIQNDKLYLNHAGVPDELSGQGVGKVLAKNTFEYIKEHSLEAVAICPYLVALVKRNPEWNFIEIL
ncbi:MAG: GNAT family N-acetyltransferase [Burkholderiales bacterium]|nr:GNAT family N-acetyltransferase [Burkholderiales bacterium]